MEIRQSRTTWSTKMTTAMIAPTNMMHGQADTSKSTVFIFHQAATYKEPPTNAHHSSSESNDDSELRVLLYQAQF